MTTNNPYCGLMMDIKKGPARKMSNPIPEEKRIFFCPACKDHKYFPQRGVSGNCRDCDNHEAVHPNQCSGFEDEEN